MISDVLSDAVDQIDRYLGDDLYASVYCGETRIELIRLRDAMNAARAKLDKAGLDGRESPQSPEQG